MKQRLAYLDNLKILLVVGVIALHAAITYGFDGSWYLESYDEMASAVVDVLTVVLGTGWLFGLGLFFLIPQPAPRPVRVYTNAELEAIAAELPAAYEPLPMFGAATGLRPEEWRALERRDVDRARGIVNVRRTVSSGEVVELGKTTRSRRQVPLSGRALDALAAIPPRLDTPYVFAARRGGLFDLHNFRRRVWAPAIEAAAIRRPARIYDLRSTFASNALTAGVRRLRASAGDGHKRPDDRAPIRDAARRRRCRHRRRLDAYDNEANEGRQEGESR